MSRRDGLAVPADSPYYRTAEMYWDSITRLAMDAQAHPEGSDERRAAEMAKRWYVRQLAALQRKERERTE